MNLPFKKKPDPDFSKPQQQRLFVEKTTDAAELLHKELEINEEEQVLLSKRIQEAKNLINQIPATDTQYNMLITQIQMDQIELDELKSRLDDIKSKLKE